MLKLPSPKSQTKLVALVLRLYVNTGCVGATTCEGCAVKKAIAEGWTVTESTFTIVFTPPFTPPLQGNNAPPQLAVAITWRTAKKRGYAKSGRMYIPTAVTNVTGTGAMAQQPAEQIAAAGARFIAGLNGLGLLNAYRAAIFSKHAGEVNPITRVEVGTVIDTQQRRRRQIPEVYFGGDV